MIPRLTISVGIVMGWGCNHEGGSDGKPGGLDVGSDGGDASPVGDAMAAVPAFPTESTDWQYVPIEGAQCGNGTQMGVAVRARPGAENVQLFLAGGRACWDAVSCFVVKSATHIESALSEAAVLAEARSAALRSFFPEDGAGNAFEGANWVYVPYCTGDLHAGTRTATYELLGGSRTVAHMGARNIDLVLDRIRATWFQPKQVWVTGVSAGGYGATINWWRVAEAFPNTRVDALSDSGLPIAPSSARMQAMRTAWAPRFPPGCTACEASDGGNEEPRSFAALLPHYAASMPLDAHYGLLAYRQDAVIGLYFERDANAVERALTALRSRTTAHQRTFYVDGLDHVLSSTPGLSKDGTSVELFIQQFANRDQAFEHVGP